MTTPQTYSTGEAFAHSGGEHLTHKLRSLAQRPAQMSVRELVHRYMHVFSGRDTTRSQRLIVWSALLGDFTLEALDADLIHAVRDELRTQPALVFKGTDFEGRPIFKPKRGGAPKTTASLNRYLVVFSAVCTWAIERRLAPRGWGHPCRAIKRLPESDGRVRFLDDAERARLLTACKASKYPRLYALALTAMLTGARKGELLALRWRDLDLDTGIVLLGRTKNGDRRTLLPLPQVVEALRPFIGDADRYVFGSTRSRYQQPANFGTSWRDAVARA